MCNIYLSDLIVFLFNEDIESLNFFDPSYVAAFIGAFFAFLFAKKSVEYDLELKKNIEIKDSLMLIQLGLLETINILDRNISNYELKCTQIENSRLTVLDIWQYPEINPKDIINLTRIPEIQNDVNTISVTLKTFNLNIINSVNLYNEIKTRYLDIEKPSEIHTKLYLTSLSEGVLPSLKLILKNHKEIRLEFLKLIAKMKLLINHINKKRRMEKFIYRKDELESKIAEIINEIEGNKNKPLVS